MIIEKLETFQIAVPLKKPFKTALRTVTTAEAVIVKITCDNGITGWGEAPPTHVITGDSLASIQFVMTEIIRPLLIGKSILNREALLFELQRAAVGNTNAKAAADMALYDCFAQLAGLPLYQLLGGYRSQLETDFTVSVNDPEEMAADAKDYIEKGFRTLKIKVGKDAIETDLSRIEAVRQQAGPKIKLRLDANQGWDKKTAVRAIREMEERGLGIELVEQPVPAHDFDGLKYITEKVHTPIMADESLFSPQDAVRLLRDGCVDLLNIKLMKAGGIQPALDIARIAAAFGVDCMVGCMIESRLGITAAAHLAASQKNITRVDFDAPLMLKEDLVEGGVTYNQAQISLGNEPGLGVRQIRTETNDED